MVSCIELETASLVFSILSLITTSFGCITSVVLIIYLNILSYALLNEKPIDHDGFMGTTYTYNTVPINIAFSVSLTHMAVSLAFSIILIKGLISKRAHLVKAYFIYGVTKNALWSLFGLIFTMMFSNSLGIASLFGCLIYSFILLMIKKTYLKMSSYDYDQFNYKKPQEEKPSA